MPKKAKSSASSATRKKQAAKAAKKAGGEESNAPQKPNNGGALQRGQKKVKGKKAEPKKKVYIAPVKPKPDVIDPLDSMGLANLLPSELVVLLRKASKKDVLTRTRALEGLLEWIGPSKVDLGHSDDASAGEQDDRQASLTIALPCWIHLFPRLAYSPNRRLRQLTIQISTKWFQPAALIEELVAQPAMVENIIGPLLVVAHGPDRLVSRMAQTLVDSITTWNSETADRISLADYMDALVDHFTFVVFHESTDTEDGSGAGGTAVPVHTGTRDAKNRDEVNVEEDQEATDGRLVVGALGSLGWIIQSQASEELKQRLLPLLESTITWTALSKRRNVESRSLGSLSPNVRSAAWSLLHCLVSAQSKLLDACIATVGPRSLQAAFAETDVLVAQGMREALVRLLRGRPDIWAMRLGTDADRQDGDADNDSSSDSDDDDEDEDDEDDVDGEDGEDQEEKTGAAETGHDDGAVGNTWAMQLFLDYLRSGVHHLAASYPIVILLLSTMPLETFPPNSATALTVIEAMYAPVQEERLEGRDLQRAFLPAFVECLVWLTGRVAVKGSIEDAVAAVEGIVPLWHDFIHDDSEGTADDVDYEEARVNRLNSFGESRLITELSAALRKLGGIDVALAMPILRLSRSAINGALTSPAVPVDLICIILNDAIDESAKPSPALVKAVHELVRDITYLTANIVASGESIEQGVPIMNQMITTLAAAQDDDTMKALRLAFDFLLHRPMDVYSDELAVFLTSYVLLLRLDEERRQTWCALLGSIVRSTGEPDWSMLRAVSRATVGKERASVLDGSSDPNLDAAFSQHFRHNASVAARIVARPAGIISVDATNNVLHQIVSLASPAELTILEEWLKSDKQNAAQVLAQPELHAVAANSFRLSHFAGDRQAAGIWRLLSRQPEAHQLALQQLRQQALATDTELKVVIDAAADIGGSTKLRDMLPDPPAFNETLERVLALPIPASMALHDALVPLGSVLSDEPRAEGNAYDAEGLSSIARVSIVLLTAFEEDSSIKQVTDLPYLISLAIAAEDARAESGPSRRNAYFDQRVDPSTLDDLIRRAISASTSTLSATGASLNQAWFVSTAKVLQRQAEPTHPLQGVLLSLWNASSTGAVRVFGRLLRGILNFSDAGTNEAEALLRLAQWAARNHPWGAMAIHLATKELAGEMPLYDRLRNQAAADLAGVRSAEVNTKGVELLRSLYSLAPPQDSVTLLVPQQRAIFTLRTIQDWLASDEELCAELSIRLAQVFVHVLPIVQEMPGSHLDLIIDVVEMNLAEANLDTPLGLYGLDVTLDLLDTLIETAARSATLREVWKDRSADVLQAFHDVVLTLADRVEAGWVTVGSAIHTAVLERTGEVLRVLPATLFRQDSAQLAKLLSIEGVTSLTVTVYRLLAHNIREHVRDLVVEAAVRSKSTEVAEAEGEQAESTTTVPHDPQSLRIPDYLLDLVQRSSGHGQSDTTVLLAWLAIFEHFEESSLDLRAAYTAHLQSLHMVEAQLLPFLLARYTATSDPSRYALDELFLDQIDGATDVATSEVFAIHVFYRALIHLPNLVRDAFFSLKDRQQSNALRTLTVRHLTPMLSQREFGHLRQPETLDRLQDESMQIKVLANVGEVVATYTVDEYPLEIAISMPNDYPLHAVEVRDIRKIGISEGTWRAWILGMRQLIAGRNGLIVDALLLFKRNVEAKFSGFDEDSTCAICYSIVSPTDHSLPTKPCKTCKKKFHSSCLFKWVSTSGSSTCPLCRSIL